MLKTKFKKSKIKASQKGFTLVELMVVVGIIGILASIAVPQFQIYQAKARTSEAKIALGSIYSAQTAFQMEESSYATCLFDMGFKAGGVTGATYSATSGAADRYYTVGFQAEGSATITGCTQTSRIYNGTKGGNAVTAFPVASTADTDSFLAYAHGTVDKSSIGGAVYTGAASSGDVWTINQDKSLEHVKRGY